jgi:hypothetical protein
MSGESNYYEGDPVNALPNVGSYLPADNALQEVNVTLKGGKVILVKDPYAGKVKWVIK